MKTFLKVATDRAIVATSAKVAVVVGSILALINYGDRIFLRHDMRLLDWVKVALTYCVPYCVSTYGAVRYAMRRAEDTGDRPTKALR
jgi:hypothetical protein